MENNPLLMEQSVKKSSNSFSENLNTGKKSKQLYVLNLDGSRIFWILSIILLLMTFVLLLGYWIGSDASSAAPTPAVAPRTAANTVREPSPSTAVTDASQTNVRITEERIAPAGASPVQSRRQTASAGANTPATEQASSPAAGEERLLDTENSSSANVGQRSGRETRRRIARSLSSLRRRRGIDTRGSDKYMTRSKPYSIQIATHTSYRSASAVRRALRKKRFPAYIFMHKTASGKKFYKIRVGTFSSRGLAMKYIEKIKRTSLGRRSIIVHR